MKIATIVGARPQFIKLAPFSEIIRNSCREVIIHSGQHFDDFMSNQFFKELNIPKPDYNLSIKSSLQGEQTAQMMIGIESILISEKPDVVVVFGDTNTTIAGALVASKLQIPVVHIEAGLRSFNRSMPEELNRIVTDHLSDLLLAPTRTAMKNLDNEGLKEISFLLGDIMVDSIHRFLLMARRSSDIISKLQLQRDNYYLLTLHRPYNVDNPDKLHYILSKLNELKKKIIFPIHPRTINTLKALEKNQFKNISFIQPVGYLDMLILQEGSSKIITDSGGIQKEAYILKVPCVTLRPETEWIETVNDGWNLLFDTEVRDYSSIIDFLPAAEQKFSFGENVANKMVELIMQKFCNAH